MSEEQEVTHDDIEAAAGLKEESSPEVEPSVEEPAAAEAPEEDAPVVDAKEIEEGKVFAILGYVIPILCLIPLIQRNNEFSLFHAKQVLVLWLGMIAISFVNIIPCVGQIVWVGVALTVLVIGIMGLVSAIKGEMTPLPIVGAWAAEWFKSVTKIES